MRLSVLLFNSGTENEGIYTLNINGQNTVLAFEDEDDAIRYSLLLEAQDFLTPTIETLDRGEIEAFCDQANLTLNIIEKGAALAIPPAQNVAEMEWSPEGKLPEKEEPVNELDLIRQRLERLL